MKILRAIIDGVTVYIADDRQGKAEMPLNRFKEYVKALDIISDFERDVDRQYEKP